MRSKRIFLILISAIVGILAACAHYTYTYNNVKYDSPESILAAQEADQAAILSKIMPLPQSLDKAAIIILPSATLIEKYGIKITGKPSDDIIRFNITFAQNGNMATGETIEKRQIFKNVRIVQSDKPEAMLFSEDVAVYLAMPDPASRQWYVKKKDGITPVPVSFDKSIPNNEQRINAWLESIYSAAR